MSARGCAGWRRQRGIAPAKRGAGLGDRINDKPRPGGLQMDFTPSPRVEELKTRIGEFMDRHIYPAEQTIGAESDLIRPGVPYPPSLVTIRSEERRVGKEW